MPWPLGVDGGTRKLSVDPLGVAGGMRKLSVDPLIGVRGSDDSREEEEGTVLKDFERFSVGRPLFCLW